MKCQKCKVNEATTHITQIINGTKTEMYLCRECANDNQELFDFNKSLEQEFDSLFSGFWNSPQLAMSKAQNLSSPKKCDICGMNTSEFLRNGKPGCSNCYTVFADYLLRPLKQIHGSTHHNGKIPSRSGKFIRLRDTIDKLETKLSRAILEQNFEEAAVLRDRIKELKENQDREEI